MKETVDVTLKAATRISVLLGADSEEKESNTDTMA
jgi:hypothetical protein